VVVGVLTSSYPRFPGDAAGSFVGDDVRSLVRQGRQVEVLAAGDGPCAVTRAVEEHLLVTRISTGVAAEQSLFYGQGAPEVLERGGPRAWAEALHFAAALCAAARAAAPRWDAMVSHWLIPCALVGAVVAPRLDHQAYAHSGDVALLERLPLGHSLARYLAASGMRITFASGDLKARFAALAGRAVGMVGRLRPDVALFPRASATDRAQARRHLGLRGPIVMSTGRLVPIKGYDLLLDAVGSIVIPPLPQASEIDVDPKVVEVVILGAGPEREALRARARRHNVSLRLPGAIPRDQVALWLAAADLYVQPSRALPSGRTEGLPVATLEALAVGLPVIAARSGGLGELGPHDGRVSFFEPGDANSLRQVLSSALRAENCGSPTGS
jgi:glycosyltransferase involved in cell wall biosynthesis